MFWVSGFWFLVFVVVWFVGEPRNTRNAGSGDLTQRSRVAEVVWFLREPRNTRNVGWGWCDIIRAVVFKGLSGWEAN